MSDSPLLAIGEPIRIHFDGLDASHHQIELGALADSLKGLSRIIAVAANFAATERFVQHKDALSVRVVAIAPQRGSVDILAWAIWGAQHPLISTFVGGSLVSLIAYIFKRAAGQKEEMRHLRAALEVAIRELGTRDQVVIDRLLTTVDRMADALKPAAKQAVAPVGETAATLSISGASSVQPAIVVDAAEKASILREDGTDITPEQQYSLHITELDVETGTCKLVLGDTPEERTPGRITDPSLTSPNNAYATALSAQTAIKVKAKAEIRNGEIVRLYISDSLP